MGIYSRRPRTERPERPVGIEEPNEPTRGGQLRRCGVCDRTSYLDDLCEQRGLLVCDRCLDWPGYKQPEEA